MLRIERCGTARIGVSLLDYVELWNIKFFFDTAFRSYDGYVCVFLCCCVCSVCFVCFSYWSLSPLTRAGVPVVWGCVRALNFVHYVRCVKIFYARRLPTLRELLQKPPYVVAVLSFAFIWFIYHYDTNISRGNALLCAFIARQHSDARYWYSKSVRLSVRLSVRPSVTFRYQMKTA